jgi:predicted membrane-bound mannosyltransferase
LVVFGLSRATDAAARYLPALAGAALVALPYWARDLLGRRGALCAAALLAFSPAWLYLSRTGDGTLLSTGAAAVALLALVRLAQGGCHRWLRVMLVALALGATAGSGIYTPLLAVAVYGAINLWIARRYPERATPWHDWVAQVRTAWRWRELWIALGVLVVSATAFSINPGGLGATFSLLGGWLGRLAPTAEGLPWSHLGRTLLTYEALTLALATVGLIWGLWQRDHLEQALAIWLAVALVLGLALGHRGPAWTLDALLPLVLLAARGAERLWRALAPEAGLADVVAGWVALSLLGFVGLELISYAHTGQTEFLWYALLSAGVLALGIIAHGFWSGFASAARVATLVLLVALTVITVRASTALAYQTARDPREPLVGAIHAAQVRTLEQDIATFSSRRAKDPRALQVAYERALGPVAEWYLRDYARAEQVASVGEPPQAQALLTMQRSQEAYPGGYAAQRYRWVVSWPQQNLSSRDRLRWFLQRQPVGYDEATYVHLWIRLARGD